MAIFNGYVTNDQRVHLLTYYKLYVCATCPLSLFIKHRTGRHGCHRFNSFLAWKSWKCSESPGEVRRSGAAMIWMRYFSVNPDAFEHFSMTRHLFACGLMPRSDDSLQKQHERMMGGGMVRPGETRFMFKCKELHIVKDDERWWKMMKECNP